MTLLAERYSALCNNGACGRYSGAVKVIVLFHRRLHQLNVCFREVKVLNAW